MDREPTGLYVIRVLVSIGLLAFIIMLYWSSSLLEDDMKVLHSEMNQLKNELSGIRENTNKIRNELLDISNLDPSQKASSDQYSKIRSKNERSEIDPNLPNLLEEDPFYTTTLPKLLGENFQPQGVFHSDVLAKPDSLHPFTNWAQVNAWMSQCNVTISKQKFGKYETMSPDMALKMEERKNSVSGKTEYWIHLRDQVFWQPLRQDFFSEGIKLAPHFLKKHPVTAHDFKFFVDALMNPSVQEPGAVALRNYLGDIEAIEVINDRTFIVRWKTENVQESDGKIVPRVKYVSKLLTGSLRPLARFVYQYFSDGSKIVEDDSDPNTYRTNSVWAQNFSQHWAKQVIVSCGAWIFDGMSERQINFRRNPDHYDPLAVLAEGSVVHFKDSADAMWQDFKANSTDSYDIRPDQLLELEEFLQSPSYQEQSRNGAAIHRLEYLARSYVYIGWNEAKPYFRSKKVRQALTMAIDRKRIIQQNLNGMGLEITGPFARSSPSYDPTISPWPYDIQQAKRFLEEEGWYDSDGDGIIDKKIDGKVVPFQFSLTYFVRNPTTKSICEYVSTALKEVGIACNLNGVDIADISAVFDDKSFDSLCLAWSLGTPPEDPRQLWYSAGAKEKGSSNAIGFANAEADKIIDALQYESDVEKRLALYHRFDAIMHEEQPYTFLFSAKTTMVYRDYLQNVFIPAKRQDLVPGANVSEPDSSAYWLRVNKDRS